MRRKLVARGSRIGPRLSCARSNLVVMMSEPGVTLGSQLLYRIVLYHVTNPCQAEVKWSP
jgi:hypothetical protein